jgi:tetratricopeptide (TPR) repeat protein
MNLRKHQEHITSLYKRGDFEGAKEGFEQLILYCEEAYETDQLDYWEALLGLGTLNQKDLDDLPAAEKCWKKLVGLVGDLGDALALDSESFDIYTQGLLLLALVQKEEGKSTEAEKNLELLRAIAVETRGEKSADVKAIDEHLNGVRRKN